MVAYGLLLEERQVKSYPQHLQIGQTWYLRWSPSAEELPVGSIELTTARDHDTKRPISGDGPSGYPPSPYWGGTDTTAYCRSIIVISVRCSWRQPLL